MPVVERPPLATVVATNVYRLRVMRVPKWSQDRLAEAAGVGVNTLQLIEAARDPAHHQPRVRLDTIERLATALGVEPAELLRWDHTTRAYLQGRSSSWTPRVHAGEATSSDLPRQSPIVVAT